MLLAGLLIGFVSAPAAAQLTPPPLFEEVLAFRSAGASDPVPAVRFNAVAWGDHDGDGDLDLFITGNRATFKEPRPFSQLYLNIGDAITELIDPDDPLGFRTIPITRYEDALNVDSEVMIDVWLGAVALGDYDGDGDLDVLATGVTASGAYSTDLYENINNFRPGALDQLERRFSWPGVRDGALAWCDYDNDGDLDFVIAGTEEDGGAATALYENQVRAGSGFMRREDPALVGLHSPALVWGDYDNDGDHDLLMTGVAEPQTFVTRLYRNDGGLFTDANAGLKGLLFAALAWGDYDADGDLDILLSGAGLHPFILDGEVKIYENTGGAFTDGTVTLGGAFEGDATPGRYQGGVGWGDFNNDGFLDFFVAGLAKPNDASFTQVYRYTSGNRFVTSAPGNAHLPGRFRGGLFGSTFWGDYNGDNDLDLFVLGDLQSGAVQLVTLRNNLTFFPPNTLPSAPGGLQATPQGTSVTLQWNAAQDAQTPAPGLTYNLRVGTTPGGTDVVSPMALPATGHRLLAARGNAGHNLQWTLKNLPPGTYFWSVQTIDNSYKGSPFAPEGMFVIQ